MKDIVFNILKKSLIANKIKISDDEILKTIEIPPNIEMGDFAFPCFFLSAKLKENPHDIALLIREKIGNSPKEFEDIQVTGPYVNFFVERKEFAKKTLNKILKDREKFGKQNIGNGKTMIEFSQPNTHKAFHVGHIRGTSIGESIARISEFLGEEVIRANYSGDTGMHVAKWIWCYKKYHSKDKLKNDESWIASIYVDAVKRLTKNEKLQEEVNEINRKLESKEDPQLNELWENTRKISIDSWKKIYEELNTNFDVYFFESEVEKRAKEIANELVEKKIAIRSDGALIMDLKKYNFGVWVLLRQDGTVLYSAKDLALAERKFKEFKINKNVYIVGAAQSLHIAQLFKTLELMKLGDPKKNYFVPYSEVRLPSGKMSSRTGENILYSSFIEKVTDYAKKQIKKREKKISIKELENRSLKISIAAIKYFMLRQNSNKNIIFKIEDALNFEGDSGAYILYSYARANSITEKSKIKNVKLNIFKMETKEFELVKKLSEFPEIVLNAYNNLNPSLIANYSHQLAQTFNEFYHSCPVIKSKNESFRIALVESFKNVIKSSFNLLGIGVIEKM